MFPLHSGDELFFNASSNPHQQYNIPEDLIFGRDSQDASNITNNTGKSRRRRKSCAMDTADDTNSDNNKKKMMHRDIERQRRQEMATLHASLRSLLPLEYIKVNNPKYSSSFSTILASNFVNFDGSYDFFK